MYSRQKGITLVGFVLLAAIVGLLGLGALKLTPHYLQNMKIKRVLADVKDELDGNGPNPQLIRRSIDKRINIEMIDALKAKDFQIEKIDSGFRVTAAYDRTEPFVGNVYLLVDFSDEVEIQL
ncbi:MAG: DUF4845 domain-containing protein [Gammaproteobacteria bacterium]|jgi:hypothetical protein|nr:DUF4845 domain-containing protein [Gammaproteobacteria bacterium]